MSQVFRMCSTCGGSGWNNWAHCSACRGTGKVPVEAHTVPPHVAVSPITLQARVEKLETLLRECVSVLDQEEGHGRALAERIQEVING